MIKVFLAEDEYVIRAGIRNNVDWEAHGYEFCGEAGDGELAFSGLFSSTNKPGIQKIKTRTNSAKKYL